MSYQEENVELKIIERIESLTIKGVITWQLIGYKYTGTYGGLSFEIEDTGQNWLVINRENNEGEDSGNIGIIMDKAGSNRVRSLLETIKHSLKDLSLSYRQFRLADLEVVLDILQKEA